MTEFGDGFVAVGTPVCDWRQEPWACQLSAWATDGTGRAWVRSPDQPAFDMGGGGEALIPEGLFDVTDGPAGLVAIGHPLDGSSGAVWHSRDGRTWERLPLVFEDADPIAVASGPLGYVITARDIAPGPDRIGTAYAWFSADGRTWVPREDGPDLDVGPCHDTTEIPSCAGMRAVAATPTGFVAVGSVAGPDGERGPAVWSTPDGRTWKRTSVPLGVGDGLADIVWTGTELIAVGGTCGADCADGRADGLIATSSDGSTWAVERPSGAPDFDLIAGDDRQRWAVSLRDAETIDTLQLWRSDQTGTWELVDDLPAMPSGLTFLHYGAVDIEVVADGSVLLVGRMEVRGSIEGGLDLSLVRS